MKKVLLFLLVIAVLAGAWFLFKSRNAETTASENDKPAARVETALVADQPIARTIEVFGVVGAAPSGDRVTTVAYDVIVRQVRVSVGTPVAAGDVLLEVDPSPEAKLAAESARSMLATAKKTLAAAQERYDLKLSSSQELLTAQQIADDAKLKVESLDARGFAGDGRIVAMAAGVVSKIDVSPGALAPAGTALVTVATGGQLEVRLGVEAAEVASMAPGQPVTLESTNRAEPEKITATIRTVGRALDPATGAAEARVAVPSGAPLLLGEHVRANIELEKKEHALVVPRSAVLPDEGKQVLFTVKDGKAIKHEVKLGLATDELVEISGDGLAAGDTVVTLGNYELEDGMVVQLPENEGKPAGAKPAVEAKP